MATLNQLCNGVSVRLDDTNYHIWHFLMRHYLRGHGLLKFVDGSYHCPSQFQRADYDSLSIDNTGAFEKWLQQDSCVISLITASLSADALTLVIGCETSMEVWTTLKQHYAPKSEFHIMRLKSTLQNIRKGSDSIHKYLLRFKDVQNQLAVAGVRMSDEDMKTLILAGLPSEYAHTRQIIRGKNSITMEEVRCLLLSAEFEFEVEHKAHHLSPFTAMVAHNAITSGNLSLSYTQGSQFGVSPYNLPYVTSGVTRYSAYNMSPTCTSQVGYAPPPTTMTSNSGFVNPPTISVGCSQYSAQNFKGTFTHPSGSVAENGGLCSNFCSTNSGSNLSQQSYIGLEQLQSTPQFYRDSSHPQQLSGSPSPNFSGFSQNNLTSPQQFGASSHGGNTSQSQNNNGEYSYGNGGYSYGNGGYTQMAILRATTLNFQVATARHTQIVIDLQPSSPS
ncbi:uncharacterized protein LOC133725928 [Rosa rugosa]|uniref:uncharacterized protein LOC133725928 n=1 Tax=Rosa rugosa TaxID=74645 RepID=UPI002B40D6CA|nr:uncharacterized protein LOC133725928 [Rosa rugosa]XP_062009329.1 uncharacterized protein LOC133725928 [Rosa rugosa]